MEDNNSFFFWIHIVFYASKSKEYNMDSSLSYYPGIQIYAYNSVSSILTYNIYNSMIQFYYSSPNHIVFYASKFKGYNMILTFNSGIQHLQFHDTILSFFCAFNSTIQHLQYYSGIQYLQFCHTISSILCIQSYVFNPMSSDLCLQSYVFRSMSSSNILIYAY